ncbi:MAG: AAA family ATPase, partial [Terriglobales bacterium]
IRAAIFPPSAIEYSTGQDDFCMKIALEATSYLLRKNPSWFVFLDGRPFSRTYQIDEVLEAAKIISQDWRILECTCSEETARRRLQQQAASREHPATNRTFELYLRVKALFEEITLPKFVIDTDQPLEVCVYRSLEFLA